MTRIVRSLFSRLVPVVVLGGVLGCCPAGASQPASSVAVDVVVRVFAPDGSPVEALTKRDFRLRSGGLVVPFELSVVGPQPVKMAAFPTYALLDFSSSGMNSQSAGWSAPKVDRLFGLGWKISVLDAKGVQTPYVGTQAELEAALARPAGAGMSEAAAIHGLSAEAGRHVVFVFEGAGKPVGAGVVAATSAVLGIVYVIDPAYARPVTGRDGTLFQAFTGSGDAITAEAVIPGTIMTRRVPAGAGPVTEATLQQAMEDAVEDGVQYYELRVRNVAASQVLRLDVRTPSRQRSKWRIVTQMYGGCGALPRLVLGE